MLILGQGVPSGMELGSRGVSSVQGQPFVPLGGAGSSDHAGQRIVIGLSLSSDRRLPSFIAIPFICSLQAFSEVGSGCKAEFLLRLVGVQLGPGLEVSTRLLVLRDSYLNIVKAPC